MKQFHPFIKIPKGQIAHSELLPWLLPLVPPVFRDFCVFVIAESEKILVCGSGVATPRGVYTASHLFWFPFEKVFVTFYIDKHNYITIPIEDDIIINRESDVALLSFIADDGRILPLPSKPKKGFDIKSAKVFAYGSPVGVYGCVWEPEHFIMTPSYIITRGVIIPGISGGGILINQGEEWYLWAIHSFGYLDSKTLYSSRLW